MFRTVGGRTRFYRVTDVGRTWQDVISGVGSYFSSGGRYNRIQQRTVYASADPLVSLAEAAFHQAVKWQMRIGQGSLSVLPPLPRPSLHPLRRLPRPRLAREAPPGQRLPLPPPPAPVAKPLRPARRGQVT